MAEPDAANQTNRSAEHDPCEASEPPGELRHEWVVNPKAQRKAAWVAAAMGAWGVLCGWLVFIKVLAEEEEKLSLNVFVFALLVASLVGLVSETMQELIHGARVESKDEEEAGNTSILSVVTRDAPRIVFLIVMIALFDLYSDAGSDFVKAWGKGKLQGMFEHAVLPMFEGVEKPPWLDFTVMVLLWTAVGAIIAFVLARGVVGRTGPRGRQAKAGLLSGLLAGCVAAPAGVLLYILVLRVFTVVFLILFEHAEWDKYLSHLATWGTPWALPVFILDWLAHAPYKFLGIPYVGGVLVAAGVAWLVRESLKERDKSFVKVLAAGAAVLVVAPLLEDFGNLLLLLAFAALIWSVPGAVLGASVPYLKRPSLRPRIWGPLALFMGAALALLAWLRLADSGFYVAAFMLFFAGWLLLRSGRVEDYWPLLALCVAMVICGVTTIAQQVTFLGVFERVHAVNSLPHDVRANIYADRGRERDWIKWGIQNLEDSGLLPKEDPYVFILRMRLAEMDKLPPDEQLRQIDQIILPEIEEKRLALADSVWRALHWEPGPFATGPRVKEPLSKIDPQLAQEIEASGRLPLEQHWAKIEELKQKVESRRALLLDRTCIVLPLWARRIQESQPDTLTGRRGPSEACVYKWTLESLDKKRELSEMILVRREYPPETSSPLHRGIMSVPMSLKSLEEIRAGLLEGREKLRGRVRALEVKRRWEQERIAQKLELSLTGSLGFWVTVGLLAGWAIIRNQRLVEPGHRDGRPRCFWAKGDIVDYHDREHGREPADDREFFRRLSLEMLTRNTFWRQRHFFERLFNGFIPERVAAMSADELKKKHEHTVDADERRALGANLTDVVPMVVENAKRLVALYETDSRKPDSTGRTFLNELKLLAQTDEAALAEHVRTFFQLPAETPVGTFLQSAGLIPGAHYEGCAARMDATGPSHGVNEDR